MNPSTNAPNSTEPRAQPAAIPGPAKQIELPPAGWWRPPDDGPRAVVPGSNRRNRLSAPSTT